VVASVDNGKERDQPANQWSWQEAFRVGDWLVDPAANRLRRADREVRLEPKVMHVLLYLVEHHGKVVSRRDLESAVWRGMIVTDEAVTNSVIKLRRALDDDARRPRYIETIPKTGYRLIAQPVATVAESPADDALVAQDPGGVPPSNGPRGPERGRRRSAWLAAGAAVFFALTAGWWALRPIPPAAEMPMQVPGTSPEPPVIAVLPFENLAPDPAYDYFADGVTEDLITDLSKLSGLHVLARQSVQPYRGSSKTESEIGLELGARYLVRGSTRRDGDSLRVNVRLVDVADGVNRWAERYDRQLAGIFQVQDEITARVVAALQIELVPGERARLVRRYYTSVEAYDHYLRGLDLLGRRSGPDNAEAKAYFERAITLDSGFALAYAGQSQAYAQDAVYERGPRVVESLKQAESLARQALAIDANLPQTAYVLGFVEMFKGNLAAAVAEVSRAIELRPSYADAHALMARILHFAGRPDDGMHAMQRAVALNPQVPALYRMVWGSLLYQLERYDEATHQLQNSVESSPGILLSRLYLAAVYAATGEQEAASWEIEEIRIRLPEFTLDSLEYGFPYRDPRLRERFVADLKRAGLGQ
jgi:TolB-like protein/DNA-binding winged helix-turn-helix (wHTH) protein